ncbi:sugar phosphate isomerase/epimerase [Terrimicrobium sacchariphilum]|uniref:Sugar phosphate isomerase/epimerase n=1 Tax=Terrimicrobium sacchariphilum TaxID=690879 RepID=A0A146GCH2_TERSA|nr:sugar phosphate isomerase/epimerase [Terrimicrobium sacchariphilum]GAT35289.1 sugar phosphate isomerase/epimerase [Terrimicrobium sacchariphilum]
MKKPLVSLQMWTLRDVVEQDFRHAVTEVAAMGYHGVELAGYGNLNAQAACEAVREAGLKVSGMHVGIDLLKNDRARVIDEAALFETRDIICPWMAPEAVATRAQCEALGEEFNEIGAALRAHGLRFSYHNHGHEIATVDGRTAFEWVLDAAEPRNLSAEVDVYWVQHAGKRPQDLLHRLGSRVPLIHLKDGRMGDRQCEIGLGAVNFDAIFAAAEEIGVVEWYVAEQEEYEASSLKSARMCIEQLRLWGRA